MLIWSAPRRQAVRDFYAFCRLVDDIADESPANRTDRIKTISGIEEWIRAQPTLGHPFWDRFRRELDRAQFPSQILLNITRGVRRDLNEADLIFESWHDLEEYIFDVAGSVGLGVLSILGTKSNQALEYAIQLGRFVQYINIMRDLELDIARRKFFIPQMFLKERGIAISNTHPHDLAVIREELFARATAARTKALPFESSCLVPEMMAAIYREGAMKYWRYGLQRRLSKPEKAATALQTVIRFWLHRKSLSSLSAE